MPHKPLKPCRYPGCPNLTDGTYCDKHKAQMVKEYNSFERSPNHNKKYGCEWKRIRDRYVKKHPLCERCLKEGSHPLKKYTILYQSTEVVPMQKAASCLFVNRVTIRFISSLVIGT